jgi:hypothetical protein
MTFVEDRLPAEPLAVPLARHALAMALLTDVPDPVVETVVLLANEAVTSALRATTRQWRLQVDMDDQFVRVAVRYEGLPDSGSELDRLRDALFEDLSSSWGIDPSADGVITTIWFEVGLAPRESPAPLV